MSMGRVLDGVAQLLAELRRDGVRPLQYIDDLKYRRRALVRSRSARFEGLFTLRTPAILLVLLLMLGRSAASCAPMLLDMASADGRGGGLPAAGPVTFPSDDPARRTEAAR